MPDITMCSTFHCRLKHECHRFMAQPDAHHQSYAAFPPDTAASACGMFIPRRPDVMKPTTESKEEQH